MSDFLLKFTLQSRFRRFLDLAKRFLGLVILALEIVKRFLDLLR